MEGKSATAMKWSKKRGLECTDMKMSTVSPEEVLGEVELKHDYLIYDIDFDIYSGEQIYGMIQQGITTNEEVAHYYCNTNWDENP